MDKKDLKIVISDAGEIGEIGLKKWVKNLISFLAPLGVMYLGFVMVRISAEGFQLADLYLSEYEIGGIVLYVFNGAQDFLRKFYIEQAYVVPKK